MDMILERLVFIMVGGLFAYAAHCIASSGPSVRLSITYESMLGKLSVMNRHGIPTFFAAALLTCYWGLPFSFDAASLSNMVHLMMCLTCICVGVLIFTGSMFVPRRSSIHRANYCGEDARIVWRVSYSFAQVSV